MAGGFGDGGFAGGLPGTSRADEVQAEPQQRHRHDDDGSQRRCRRCRRATDHGGGDEGGQRAGQTRGPLDEQHRENSDHRGGQGKRRHLRAEHHMDDAQHRKQREEVVEGLDFRAATGIKEEGREAEGHASDRTGATPEPRTRHHAGDRRGEGRGQGRHAAGGELGGAQQPRHRPHGPRHAGRLAEVEMLEEPREQREPVLEHRPAGDGAVPLAVRQPETAQRRPVHQGSHGHRERHGPQEQLGPAGLRAGSKAISKASRKG